MSAEIQEGYGAERESSDGLRVWLEQAEAFTRRSLQEVRNSRLMLAWVIAFPAIMYLLQTTQEASGSAVSDAIVSIGIGILGSMFVCLFVFGNQLATDLEDRRYVVYRSMPISPLADLTGRMAAGLVLAASAFTVTIVAGLATGASYGLRGPESVPIVLAAGVLTCLFWMVVAIPFVVAAGNKRIASMATTLVAVTAFILTGLNGAVPSQSVIDGPALNYLPNTLPTRLLVYHLVPAENWTELGVAPPGMPTGPAFLALLAAYAVLSTVAGTMLVNRTLYDQGWLP
ncbi:ABC transporter permease [Natrinema salaciae]|uniref:ABC-2 type transport system permease protein n=1 Tax=Natrinema salaciae TaxID=1186196 RepID=A0A1H9K599_9EURY|nr:ABC transporter permease [Natrinema salaciae]SEQ94087.1 ABC-2 type transport system permease protein [Natrinema salaciae]